MLVCFNMIIKIGMFINKKTGVVKKMWFIIKITKNKNKKHEKSLPTYQ